MESYRLVRPEHLNHYGKLFGGFLLKWVDEISWIAASRDYPGYHFVTVGMDQVAFHHSTKQGSVLRFVVNANRRGMTSVSYRVDVYDDDLIDGNETAIFSTCVTFVRIDSNGGKLSL